MSKRSLDDGGSASAAASAAAAAAALSEPATKKRIVFEPLQLGPIASLEELDLKTLAFQNQKLGNR